MICSALAGSTSRQLCLDRAEIPFNAIGIANTNLNVVAVAEAGIPIQRLALDERGPNRIKWRLAALSPHLRAEIYGGAVKVAVEQTSASLHGLVFGQWPIRDRGTRDQIVIRVL